MRNNFLEKVGIQMENEKLYAYLKQIHLLETDLYTMNQTREILENSKRTLKKLPSVQFQIPPEPQRPEAPQKIGAGAIAGHAAAAYFTGGLSLIYSGVKAAKNKKDRSQYEYDLAAWEREHAAWEKEKARIISEAEARARAECDKENAEIQFFNNYIANLLLEVENARKTTASALYSLYSLNIVHEKYRGIIPISTFCEYMETGRRFYLTGRNEMYDLYEEELRAKLIVSEIQVINSNLIRMQAQMGSIYNQLSSIQYNQALTYKAIAEGNRIASEIKTETISLLQQGNAALSHTQRDVASIKESSKMTAYFTEANARSSAAIEHMAEHKLNLAEES